MTLSYKVRIMNQILNTLFMSGFMFSYFEPNFIEKFFWERGLSNFGHVTIFAKWKMFLKCFC